MWDFRQSNPSKFPINVPSLPWRWATSLRDNSDWGMWLKDKGLVTVTLSHQAWSKSHFACDSSICRCKFFLNSSRDVMLLAQSAILVQFNQSPLNLHFTSAQDDLQCSDHWPKFLSLLWRPVVSSCRVCFSLLDLLRASSIVLGLHASAGLCCWRYVDYGCLQGYNGNALLWAWVAERVGSRVACMI